MFDGEAFGAEIVEAVKAYVARETAPLIARIAELESREPTVGKDGRDGVDGVDGKDAGPVSSEQIAEAVKAYLEANPPAAGQPGEPGQDGIDGKDGRDGIDGAKGIDGRDGEDGASAPVVAGAIKDHTGELVLTLTDGTILRTGIFDGKNGDPGRDGKDGFSLEDFDVEMKDDRTALLKFVRGDITETYELGFPIVLDRGVYKAGEAYERGDAVTWGGSMWIAQRDTAAKPESNDDWRLAVKRGRDGRDGKDGAPGECGPKGEQGMPGRNWGGG